MNIQRIKELRTELDLEQISTGELIEIDQAAEAAGVKVTDEMMAGDILDALEQLV